mmetsp:Transcript_28796/g.72309  ORF Transcript_28796/g.72309 Transcript_28796/m.72309 type:complete len:230 (+) Transcript_28796:1818-2507(+)
MPKAQIPHRPRRRELPKRHQHLRPLHLQHQRHRRIPRPQQRRIWHLRGPIELGHHHLPRQHRPTKMPQRPVHERVHHPKHRHTTLPRPRGVLHQPCHVHLRIPARRQRERLGRRFRRGAPCAVDLGGWRGERRRDGSRRARGGVGEGEAGGVEVWAKVFSDEWAVGFGGVGVVVVELGDEEDGLVVVEGEGGVREEGGVVALLTVEDALAGGVAVRGGELEVGGVGVGR